MNDPRLESRPFKEVFDRLEKFVDMRVEGAVTPLLARIEELEERVNILEAADRQEPAT